MPSVFVDTNILFYAQDHSEPRKCAVAQERLGALVKSGVATVVSAQVLQELYVNLRRKNVAADKAAAIVTEYSRWPVVSSDASLVLQAIATANRHQISLWDALIIAAALRAGASEIWSEDLNDGQDYGGVRVVNPLK